ncbi:cobalt-precorrin-6A reductase [Clostridium sp. LBM24168]
MIGLILGTSEGRDILSSLNKVTDDIFVSTATEYGGSILKEYKYTYLNTTPLDCDGFIKAIRKNDIALLVDASHPYAVNVTENSMEACRKLGIEYIRYERPSCMERFKNNNMVVVVDNYNELYGKIKSFKGTILNTTGSRNLETIMSMNLKNRIVHRVLPQPRILSKCQKFGVKIEDIIAIKGPVGRELNCAFIKNYNAKAMILKDSGTRGGTYDKITACIDCGIYAFVLKRKKIEYDIVFYDIVKLVDYIEKKYIFRR